MPDRDLQGSLLRLVIICSTGLSSFLSLQQEDDDPQTCLTFGKGQQPPTRAQFASLRSQLRKDAIALFTDAGKRATNLSLALKKSSKASSSSNGESATSGLDEASLAAAKQQIDAFTTELIPKLCFLAQKAWKERCVFVEGTSSSSQTPVESASAAAEKAKMEALAKQMGGVTMTGAELGLSSFDNYKKQANLGMGGIWARILKVHVQDLLQSVAALAEACMDERTKKAVKAAQQARDRLDGIVSELGDTASASSSTAQQLRQLCLAKTAAVWEACDSASKLLPTSNLEAIRQKISQNKDLLEDGISEMVEAIEGEGEEDQDEDDDFGGSISISPNRKKLLRKVVPVLQLGRVLHDRIGEELLKTAEASSAIDLDDAAMLSDELSRGQDDLVAAVLYGEMESEDDDDDEEAGESSEAQDLEPNVQGQAIGQRYFAVVSSLHSLGGSTQSSKAKMAWEDLERAWKAIRPAHWRFGLKDEQAEYDSSAEA